VKKTTIKISKPHYTLAMLIIFILLLFLLIPIFLPWIYNIFFSKKPLGLTDQYHNKIQTILVSDKLIHNTLLKNNLLPAPYLLSEKIITLNLNQQSKSFGYFPHYLYDSKTQYFIPLSKEFEQILLKNYTAFSQENYGEYMPWSEVKKILPLYSYAIISDFDNKVSFNIQRRAGSAHADVQPLKKEDTQIFKQLYHQQWSWKRRAVIVEIDKKRIAASMHGMPHGSGAIPDNQFPGHFCLHFRESKVHKSKQVDLNHQIMVLKAAGLLDTTLAKATPEELIDYFYTALKQNAQDILGLMLVGKNELAFKESLSLLKNIENIKKYSLKRDCILEKENEIIIPTEISYILKGQSKYKDLKINLKIIKIKPLNRWYIDTSSLPVTL
jgi:hypothetical protein